MSLKLSEAIKLGSFLSFVAALFTQLLSGVRKHEAS